MEIQEALRIMRALANGVNPQTGEALEADSVCRQPETVKALNRALGALAQLEQRERARPANAAGRGLEPKMRKSAKKSGAASTSTKSPRPIIARWDR
jgi:hypothetical protein